jgi:alpha-tubulin suppressor-like RCC1 family protein
MANCIQRVQAAAHRRRAFAGPVLAALCWGLVTACSQAIAGGTGWAWGDGSGGALGNGSGATSLTPVQVAGLADGVAIAGGGWHSMALRSDGTVWTWGNNDFGQLGADWNESRTTPGQVAGIADVVTIASGPNHCLALKADGTVWAWGSNDYGQVGDGTTTNRNAPVQVTGIGDITAIAGGDFHSLALKSDGTVWAWGDNYTGALGDDTNTSRSTAGIVPGLTGVIAISAGGSDSLALKSDGTVWAWGWNWFGQIGNDSWRTQYTPVKVIGLTDVTAIASGVWHNLAVKSDGTVWAWGYNGAGVLGDGTDTERFTPVQVMGLNGVTAIAGGSGHSLALRSDGTVWGWGWNTYGQVGDGTTTDRWVPTLIPALSGVTAISCGDQYSLALGRTSTALYAPDRTGTEASSVTLKGYLWSVPDNAWIGGRVLAFAIDGTDVGSATTDANGQGALTWTISAGPTGRTIAVRFAGDVAYNPSSTVASLTTQTLSTKVYVVDRTAKVKGYVVLKAYLYLLNNTPVAGKPMTIKLDGTVLGSGTTNASGYYQFGYTVAEGAGSGTRVVRSEWAGDAGYLASANNGMLTVTKGDLYIWPYVRSGKVGTAHPLRAYVRSLPDYVIQPGKSITFKVEGSTVGTAAVAADGWAAVTWHIPIGEATGSHTATAEFAGDAWYKPITSSTAFNVVP